MVKIGSGVFQSNKLIGNSAICHAILSDKGTVAFVPIVSLAPASIRVRKIEIKNQTTAMATMPNSLPIIELF